MTRQAVYKCDNCTSPCTLLIQIDADEPNSCIYHSNTGHAYWERKREQYPDEYLERRLCIDCIHSNNIDDTWLHCTKWNEKERNTTKACPDYAEVQVETKEAEEDE